MPTATDASASTITAVPPAMRRARGAVAALFLTNGALFANLVPRYPGIKDDLGLANSTYGLAVAAFPLGALLAGLAAAVIIRRWGSARVAVVGTIITALGTLAVGWSGSLLGFAVALFVAGCADSITDVGQNTHGLRVQRGYRRSIINSFHAIWSIGAVLGGVIAAVAIALDVPREIHLTVTALLFSAVAAAALRFCLPGADTRPDSVGPVAASAAPLSGPARPGKVRLFALVVALVVIATAGTLVEDSGSTWSAVYLRNDLAAPAAIAAYGFVALVGAQFVGRMIGDRLVDRFGQRTIARCGGFVAAAGMGTALAFPTIPGTIAGFAAAGLGVATLVPAAMHEADELPGLKPGSGVTFVSWLMRMGFLLSPPIVGLVADNVGLRYGLLVVPIAGVAVILLSGVLGNTTRATLRTSTP